MTSSFYGMPRVANWFLLRKVTKHTSLLYLSIFLRSIRNNATFVASSILLKLWDCLKYHSLLKVKSKKDALLEIFFFFCSIKRQKKISRRYTGKSAFQAIAIELHKQLKEKKKSRKALLRVFAKTDDEICLKYYKNI